MKDDSAGINRDTIIRQPKEDVEAIRAVKEASTDVDYCDGTGLDVDEFEEETKEIGIYARSWSGQLPSPEDFNAYDAKTRDSIIAWNNALILDESRRQDELIKISKKESSRKSYLSFLTNIIPIVISGVAFLITRDINALWFLSVPFITIGVNVIINGKNEDDN